MENKVKKALEDIRPSLQQDGGDVEFVSLTDKNIKVKLTGSCKGCPYSEMTLKNGIERYLRQTLGDDELVVEGE